MTTWCIGIGISWRWLLEGAEESVGEMDREAYSRLRSIAEGALQAERRTLIGLRDRGRISDDVLRTMERELDLAESQYQGMPLS